MRGGAVARRRHCRRHRRRRRAVPARTIAGVRARAAVLCGRGRGRGSRAGGERGGALRERGDLDIARGNPLPLCAARARWRGRRDVYGVGGREGEAGGV